MSDSITALMEEVNFWRYMVKEYENRTYMPEYKRITDALALAEYKLEQRLMEITNGGDQSN